MGEAYRATDTNPGRQVAIEVLPAALALDEERLARFGREAHTLADRLATGPLSSDDALPIARQITEATCWKARSRSCTPGRTRRRRCGRIPGGSDCRR